MNLRPLIRSLVAPAIAVALLIALCGVASACPTCASGMDQGDEASRKMINGWFWSIIFMMSMPFAIIGSLGGYMYYLVRKARATAGFSLANASGYDVRFQAAASSPVSSCSDGSIN